MSLYPRKQVARGVMFLIISHSAQVFLVCFNNSFETAAQNFKNLLGPKVICSYFLEIMISLFFWEMLALLNREFWPYTGIEYNG